MSDVDRRRAIVGGAGIALGGLAAAKFLPEELLLRDQRPAKSHVAIITALQYSEALSNSLLHALQLFKLDLRGKAVLLKPNLVEYLAGVEVNTNPVLVGAAADALLKLGAKRVVVGEGPGHQRDTYLVLVESGLDAQLHSQNIEFVDLNRDELVKVPTRANFTGLDYLWLPRTVLTSTSLCPCPR
jgi:uncharacterized protein (DUF362 family)